MDLAAVKASAGPELAAGVAAAARNANGLLRDAEILAEADSPARAYTLAALAVEEVGKAVSLGFLAGMPQALRATAPVGLMLEWHQWKQAAGQLVAAAPYHLPGIAAGLLAMPAADVAHILRVVEARADEADRLKRGGLYVDIGHGGRIREPSEVTGAEAARALAQARQAVASARRLLDPAEEACLPYPPVERATLTQAAVSALAGARHARTPDAAADVLVEIVSSARSAAVVAA